MIWDSVPQIQAPNAIWSSSGKLRHQHRTGQKFRPSIIWHECWRPSRTPHQPQCHQTLTEKNWILSTGWNPAHWLRLLHINAFMYATSECPLKQMTTLLVKLRGIWMAQCTFLLWGSCYQFASGEILCRSSKYIFHKEDPGESAYLEISNIQWGVTQRSLLSVLPLLLWMGGWVSCQAPSNPHYSEAFEVHSATLH